MAAPTPAQRQLKIKTGILKRYGQERQMNLKEIAQQEARIAKMQAEGRDEYDINKQNEVLEECRMMVPHTQANLCTAYKELCDLVETETASAATEEYREAKKMLEEVPLDFPAVS